MSSPYTEAYTAAIRYRIASDFARIPMSVDPHSQNHDSDAAWAWAGFQLLAAEGVDGIKVEKLAALLGISKGPFYWRYANREALLQEMLEIWQRDFTQWMIEQHSKPGTPRARIESLANGVMQVTWRGTEVARIETAMRAWAQKSDLAAASVTHVDQLRIGFLVEQLQQMGVKKVLATRMSRGIYLALVGFFSARQYAAEKANEEALLTLVGLWLDQAEAAARV